METFCLISQRQSVQSVQSTWCHYDANTCLNVVRHIEVMEISLWNLFKLQSQPTFWDDLTWSLHSYSPYYSVLSQSSDWPAFYFLKTNMDFKRWTYLLKTDSFKCSRFIILNAGQMGNLFIILLLLLSFVGGGGIWKQLVVFVRTCIILLSLCNLSCAWPTKT